MTTRLHRAHRFRLDLTVAEQTEIEDFARARQKAYNWGLALVKDTLGLTTGADEELALFSGKGPYRLLDKFALNTAFTKAKPSLPWAHGVPATAIEFAFDDLTASLSAFFAARKSKSHRKVGFPRFIRADDPQRSGFTVRGAIRIMRGDSDDEEGEVIGDGSASNDSTPNVNSRKNTHKKHDDNRARIRLPRLSFFLRVRGGTRRLEREIENYDGVIKEATVHRDGHDGDGRARWSLSIVIERNARAEIDEAAIRAATPIGGDLGLRTLLTLSDGTTVPNPRLLSARAKRVRKLARDVGRSQAARCAPALLPAIERHQTALEEWTKMPKGKQPAQKPPFPKLILPPKSHRHQKKDAALAVAHHRLRDARRTRHGQVAAKLVPKHPVIGLEDLAVSNMVRNHRQAKAISDAGWSSLVLAIETRADDRGCLVIKNDRFFASSQICSGCGVKNPAVKERSVTVWTCPNCGRTWDRDVNAAINLIPTPDQITAGLLAHTEKQEAWLKRREKMAVRVAATVVTKRTKKADRAARTAQRAAEAAAAAILTGDTSLSSSKPSARSNLIHPVRPSHPDNNRRPDAQATLNRARRTGKSGTSVLARSETRVSHPRSRPETRTDMSRRVRTNLPDGPP